MANSWISKLTKPIVKTNVEFDFNSNDDFYQIKCEINKVSGINFQLIKDKSENILQLYVKDMRVLAYLVFARLNLEGCDGLCNALDLYSKLIQAYGNSLYPLKMSSKLASLQWLNETRINHMIKSEVNYDDKQQVKKVLHSIEQINKQLQQNIGTEIQLFTNVMASLRVRKTGDAPLALSSIKSVKLNNAANDGQQKQPQNLLAVKCQSETELRELVCLQSKYLRDENQWLRATAFTRAFRWGNLKALKAVDNVSSVPAPDETVVEKFRQVVSNGLAFARLNACEELFMMQGGLYFLDLHFHESIAAKELQLDDVVKNIEDQLRALLLRFPNLINLSFSNNVPFIAPQHRAWLEKIISPLEPYKEKDKKDNVKLDINVVVNHYRALVAGKSLHEKIKVLNDISSDVQRENLQKNIAMARFCVEGKRVDLAMPLLEKLARIVRKHCLQDWDPEIALVVWIELLNVWKLRMPTLDEHIKKHGAKEIQSLFAKITEVNPECALQI